MKLKSIQSLDYNGLSATLPLENGVTTLTGANASGKTMMSSIVPGILFNETKLQSGAAIGITWDAFDSEAAMLVSKHGNKTTYRATIDGESKEHHTIKPARAWLAEHLPVSQSVFSYVNYLAAFRTGTLLGGSPAARRELLAQIVNLQVFDTLKQLVGKLAQSAHTTVAMRDRLLSSIKDLERETPDNALISLDGMANYISAKRSTIKAKATMLAEALEDRPFGEATDEQLSELLKIAPSRNKAWDDWEQFQEDGGKPAKNVTATQYATAQALQRIIDTDGDARWIINGKYAAVPNAEKHRKALAAHLSDIDNITKQLLHLEEHDGKNCPTCGSSIDGYALVKSLTRTISKLKKQTETLRLNVMLARATEVIDRETKAFKAKASLYPTLLESYEDVIEAYEASQAVINRWGGKYPEKPTKPRIDVESVRNEQKLRKRFGSVRDGERTYKALAGKFATNTTLLSVLSSLSEEQADVRANLRQLTKLRADLDNLPHTEDAELLTVIIKALENKNARDKYLELVAAKFVANLNDKAPEFFSYKMEFAWHNGQLIANRNGAATDVVLLSGREGRAFMLLSAIALMRCLPPNRRLKTLFLDELEAGSMRENRELLAEIIPTLTDYYDNIVVITPMQKSEFFVEGPRYRVIDNKGRKSLIREE